MFFINNIKSRNKDNQAIKLKMKGELLILFIIFM